MSRERITTGQVFGPETSLDAVREGLEVEEAVFGPVTRADIVAYAEASGDDNPIHQDEEYARRSGAPTVFAMGMLPAGYLATALSAWVGGPQHIRRFKVRFTTRVWPGDEIVCGGKVVAVEGGVVKFALEARRRGSGPEELDFPEEETAIVGEADVELPE
jgi:acyl dehydratase